MSHLFLSYARDDDEAFVGRLHDDLTRHGFEVWFDRTSMPARGNVFPQEIREAIAGSERLLLVIGPAVKDSAWVTAEWRFALEAGVAVVPILRLGDYELLQDELKFMDAPDFRSDADYEDALARLVPKLQEPVAPLGPLVGVPDLPPYFHARSKDLEGLKEELLSHLREPAMAATHERRIGLHGMGGVGKSVLMAALARHAEVRRAFPDGLIWVSIGLSPNLVARQQQILRGLGYTGQVDSVEEGRTHLQRLLENKSVVLLLDDVWNAEETEAFDALGPRGKLLMTTRDKQVITTLGASVRFVDLLDHDDALSLLGQWAGAKVNDRQSSARKVVEECGRLPLALSISGAMVREGTSWDDLLQAMRNADLGFLRHGMANYPHADVFKAITVGIDTLEPQEKEQLLELSVFRQDDPIPSKTASLLWRHTRGTPDYRSRQLLSRLHNRGLILLHNSTPKSGETTSSILVHSLVYDTLRELGKQEGDVTEFHQKLLDAWGDPRTLPDDYAWRHVAWHLVQAGKSTQLRELLLDYVWLRNKLGATDVAALLEDFSELDGDGVPRLVEEAIRLSAYALAFEKGELGSQLTARLLGNPDERIGKLLNQAVEREDRIWLKPLSASLTPPGTALLTTLASGGAVGDVALSENGDRIFVAALSGLIREWDSNGAELFRTGQNENGTRSIVAVALSSNGRRCVFATHEGALLVQHLDDNRPVAYLAGNGGRISTLAINGAGTCAIAGNRDGEFSLWDVKGLRKVSTYRANGSPVSAVALNQDGKRAVVACRDGEVSVWDTDTGHMVTRFAGPGVGATAAAMSANGRRAVLGFWTNDAYVWDEAKEAQLRPLVGHAGWVVAVALTPDGRTAVTGSWDKTLRVWDLEGAGQVRTFDARGGWVTRVAIDSSGKHALSGTHGGSIRMWSADAPARSDAMQRRVDTLSINADGTRVVSRSNDGTAREWEVEDGTLVAEFEEPRRVNAVARTRNGKRYIAGSPNGIVRVWDEDATNRGWSLHGHKGMVGAVSISEDGSLGLSGSEDRTLRLWNLNARELLATFEGHTGPVRAVALSADSRLAASGGQDGALKVWDLQSSTEIRSLPGHAGRLNTICLSGDGKHAVSGGDDGAVHLWNLERGELVASFRAESPISACTFAKQDSIIVAGTSFGTLHFLRILGMTAARA